MNNRIIELSPFRKISMTQRTDNHTMIDVSTIIIEVFGDYWHSTKMKSNKCDTDMVKIDVLRALGYKVIVVWESAVFKDTTSVLVELRKLCV